MIERAMGDGCGYDCTSQEFIVGFHFLELCSEFGQILFHISSFSLQLFGLCCKRFVLLFQHSKRFALTLHTAIVIVRQKSVYVYMCV
jgi:hypothetical protein